MSTLQSAAVRSQRTASIAVGRARLALVPPRPSSAPRLPFAVLVALILGTGVVGLLLFNTHMQQGSIYATQLQKQADSLKAKEQSLNLQLARLRDPQNLAKRGRGIGMVQPMSPAFVDLRTGKVVGLPQAASPEDKMLINARLADPFNRTPIVHRVVAAPPAAGTTGQTTTTNGAASTDPGAGAGTNGGARLPQGETR